MTTACFTSSWKDACRLFCKYVCIAVCNVYDTFIFFESKNAMTDDENSHFMARQTALEWIQYKNVNTLNVLLFCTSFFFLVNES